MFKIPLGTVLTLELYFCGRLRITEQTTPGQASAGQRPLS